MASVYTMDGAGSGCKRVKSGGKKRGCTIMLCKTGRRWKFKKGTYRCK
jgi:hypothetical protein